VSQLSRMTSQLIFVPVLFHILLTLSLYLVLLKRKLRAVSEKEVDFKATALNCKAWPDEAVLKCSNNLDNQFQAPVLFYAVCLILYLTGGVNMVTLVLAWTFTLSRFVHAYVHCGSNRVPIRMRVFSVGIVSLVLMICSALWQLWPHM